jgi:hypothetical protein
VWLSRNSLIITHLVLPFSFPVSDKHLGSSLNNSSQIPCLILLTDKSAFPSLIVSDFLSSLIPNSIIVCTLGRLYLLWNHCLVHQAIHMSIQLCAFISRPILYWQRHGFPAVMEDEDCCTCSWTTFNLLAYPSILLIGATCTVPASWFLFCSCDFSRWADVWRWCIVQPTVVIGVNHPPAFKGKSHQLKHVPCACTPWTTGHWMLRGILSMYRTCSLTVGMHFLLQVAV